MTRSTDEQFSRIAFVLGSALLCFEPGYAQVVSSPDSARTFGPTLA